MNPDLRRLGALTRDERRATGALERAVEASRRPAYLPRLAAERLDHDTHQRLRERVEDLLGTLEALYRDEDLWSRLESGAPGGPTSAQLERLAAVNRTDLAELFELCGYLTPPPPPAGELVDETLVAIRDLDGFGLQAPETFVRRARSMVFAAVARARLQLPGPSVGADADADRARLRTVARSVTRIARNALPIAAGAAAGALVEGLAVGFAGGSLGAAIAVAVAKKLAESAPEASLPRPGPLPDSGDDVPAIAWELPPVDGITLHEAALIDQLNGELDARMVSRNANRLAELMDDRGWPGADDVRSLVSGIQASSSDLSQVIECVLALVDRGAEAAAMNEGPFGA